VSVKWKKGFEPNVILDKLSEMRKLEGEKLSFIGFEYQVYMTVLKSMITIDGNISPFVCNRLIVKGFHEAAKKEVLKPSNVLSVIRKFVREHQAKPDKSYFLLTTLNIDRNSDLPGTTINNCTLRFYKNLPVKYRVARKAAITEVSSWLMDRDESLSHFVIAHTFAKSEYDAANNMLDGIDLLRGIWNLHISKSLVLSFDRRKKPINQITLGALHTLHKDDGSSATDTYWYEPGHYKNHVRVSFSKNSYMTLDFAKNVRKKLKSSSYGKEIEAAIIRYVRALDSQDYNVAFVKLWSLLEFLTSTLRDGYDRTIKRTVFQFADRDYNKQVLEHLRQYRNNSVHLGTGENDIDTHIYQLKGYVEQLLKFHIGNHFKFDNLSEAAKFMDLTPDIEALNKQISLYKSGIKFLGG